MSVDTAAADRRPTPPEHLQNPQNPTLEMLRTKWRRLNVTNEHWMVCIVGEEGSGKSYTALKLGELIDPEFSADNVFFHPADVLERLRDGDYDAGSVWVLDEAGVGLGNRTWQESGQKKLNQALQLIRSHNIALVFTLPALGGLDVQAKRRLQNTFEIKSKKDGEFVQGRWFRAKVDRMEFSKRSGVWWESPHIRGSELRTVRFAPPSDATVESYEAEKAEFQAEFYDQTIAELRGEDPDEDDDEAQSMAELADEIIDSDAGVGPYLSWHGGHNKAVISKEKLRDRHDLSVRDSKLLKDLLVEHPNVDPQAAWEER